MTIGIDARLYGTRDRGLGRYSENLIANLEKIDFQNQYFVFLGPHGFKEYEPGNPNFQKVLTDFPVYSLKEQLFFGSFLKKYNLDLVHFTHLNVPFFYTRRFVVTIHDLIVHHYPESRASTLNPLLYKIKLFFYFLVTNAAAQKAEKIITVSDYTKNDVIKLLKVNPEKIKVAYEGVDLPQHQSSQKINLAAHFGIKSDYLLYVGSAYPHKNLERLIRVFALIIREDCNLQLVLVGKTDYFSGRLKEFIENQKNENLKNKIIFTGYVSDAELAALYQNAKLYVFPSLIEGFGLPVLEAQLYSLPVVCSNNSSLPEILGESAVYFDPQDIKDMAQKIRAVLADEKLRNDLIQKGQNNLRRFSWKKMAEIILAQY